MMMMTMMMIMMIVIIMKIAGDGSSRTMTGMQMLMMNTDNTFSYQ